jgi:hypothetical protein
MTVERVDGIQYGSGFRERKQIFVKQMFGWMR